MSLLDWCRQLISIDSTPSVGSSSAVNFLAELSRDLGYSVEEQVEVLNGIEQKNLILRHPQSHAPMYRSKKELLLISHLDTSDPGAYGLWTETDSNPFKAAFRENKFFGLGAANAKVDFLCKLAAGQKYLQKDLKIPYVVVGSFGEQLGMMGVLKLIRAKKVQHICFSG